MGGTWSTNTNLNRKTIMKNFILNQIPLWAFITGTALAQALPDGNHLWTEPKITPPAPFLVDVDDPRDKATVRSFSEVTTNWVDTLRTRTLLPWSGEGIDPNFTTWSQSGTVISNMITEISIPGLRTNRHVATSDVLGVINRTWVRKVTREYSDGTVVVEEVE